MPTIDEHHNNVGEGFRVLERRGRGGYSVLHATTHFVVVRVYKNVYRVLPNEHEDNPRAFSAMLQRSAESGDRYYRSLGTARKIADMAQVLYEQKERRRR